MPGAACFVSGGMRRKTIMRTLYVLAAIVFIAVVLFGSKALGILPNDVSGSVIDTRGLGSQSLDGEKIDFQKEYEVWNRRIDEVGPELAYEELKERYKDLEYPKQHTRVHVFGEVLYEKMGIAGTSVCDSAFGFGCYHSFFATGISREGIETLSLFQEACSNGLQRAESSCEHGIGHGILAYVGGENLLEALHMCTRLSWRPKGGCMSGVFMEYNFLTMQDPTGISVRPPDPDDIHAPCSKLPEQFLRHCYFEQPQWWNKVFDSDYKKIGALCHELVKTDIQRTCFEGIGKQLVVNLDYNPEKIIVACKEMPSLQEEFFLPRGCLRYF